MSNDAEIRRQILWLLNSENAHATFEAAIDGLPAGLRGVRPAELPHSVWELVEHLRIAQWDIVEFTLDPQHPSPAWPEGYWPPQAAPAGEEQWQHSVEQFRADLQRMAAIVSDPARNLLAPLDGKPGGPTVMREALLLSDHNAYHIGQIVLVRRLLHAWR